eukprot:16443560-Heterocapsa_arctica.AAC.1
MPVLPFTSASSSVLTGIFALHDPLGPVPAFRSTWPRIATPAACPISTRSAKYSGFCSPARVLQKLLISFIEGLYSSSAWAIISFSSALSTSST